MGIFPLVTTVMIKKGLETLQSKLNIWNIKPLFDPCTVICLG